MRANALVPILTPHGHLFLAPDEVAPALAEPLHQRLTESFARGAGHGLLQLGASEIGTALPAAFGYWRDFGARYITAMCAAPAQAERGENVRETHLGAPPPPPDLEALAADAPPMMGAEYLTALVLSALWAELDAAVPDLRAKTTRAKKTSAKKTALAKKKAPAPKKKALKRKAATGAPKRVASAPKRKSG